METITSKKCSCCGQEKELNQDNYYRSKYTADGYADVCRTCDIEKERNRQRQWIDVHELSVKKQKALEAKQQKRLEKQRIVNEALKSGHKVCSKCGETKRLFDFHVDRKTVTGYSVWCKECKKLPKG